MHTVASSQRLAKKSNNEPVRMIAKRKRARDAALKMHNAKKRIKTISREYLPLLLFFLARGHRLPFFCKKIYVLTTGNVIVNYVNFIVFLAGLLCCHVDMFGS